MICLERFCLERYCSPSLVSVSLPFPAFQPAQDLPNQIVK